jgi:hypothetical protein
MPAFSLSGWLTRYAFPLLHIALGLQLAFHGE